MRTGELLDLVICAIDAYYEESDTYKPNEWAVSREAVPVGVAFDPLKIEDLFRHIVGYAAISFTGHPSSSITIFCFRRFERMAISRFLMLASLLPNVWFILTPLSIITE